MADLVRVIELQVRASQDAVRRLDEIQRSAKAVEDRFAGAQTSVGNFVRYGLGALAGYLTVGAITSGLFNIAKALDDIGDAAERAGIRAGQMGFLQELAKLNELDDLGTLERGLRNFNLSLADSYDEGTKAAQMLKAMRVELVEGDTAGNLQKFAQGYEQIQNAALRAAVQQEFFGKTGNDLHKFLIALSKEQGELNKHISEYEQRMGPAITAAGLFDDNLKQLKKSAFDFGAAIAGPVLESLNSFIAKANSGEFGKAIDAIHNALMASGLFEESDMWAASHGRLKTGKIQRPGEQQQSTEASEMEKRLRAVLGGKPPKSAGAGRAPKQEKTESVSDWSPLSLRWESDFPWMQAGEDASGPAEEIRRIQDAIDKLTGQDKVKEMADNLKLLDDAMSRGAITPEQYGDAIQHVFGEVIPDSSKQATDALEGVSTAITDAAGDMAEALTEADVDIGKRLENIVRSFARTILRLQIEAAVAPGAKALTQFIGKILSGGASAGGGTVSVGDWSSRSIGSDSWNALGNVFGPSGRLRAFAAGGIVNGPALFRDASNDLNVMGEDGTEGIFPLRRTRGGRLGVEGAAPVVNVPVYVSNNASGAKVSVQERNRGDGTREIAIAVEDIMDAALARGRYDSVLGAKYGMTPAGRR